MWHVTSVCQGLSSLALGGKMRDPGNEVVLSYNVKVKLWTSIADVILISMDSSDVESHGKQTCNANLMADLT